MNCISIDYLSYPSIFWNEFKPNFKMKYKKKKKQNQNSIVFNFMNFKWALCYWCLCHCRRFGSSDFYFALALFFFFVFYFQLCIGKIDHRLHIVHGHQTNDSHIDLLYRYFIHDCSSGSFPYLLYTFITVEMSCKWVSVVIISPVSRFCIILCIQCIEYNPVYYSQTDGGRSFEEYIPVIIVTVETLQKNDQKQEKIFCI